MQMTFGILGGLVDADNEVRLIDAFTDQLDLRRLGFVVKVKAPLIPECSKLYFLSCC
jgi:hypothetical protein